MSLRYLGILAGITTATLSGPAQASFHNWEIVEIFSSEDGSIQFIELLNNFNGENLANAFERRLESGDVTLDFPTNLPSNLTAGKSVLIGTDSYAALSGVPAPDYTVRDNFVSLLEDTLQLLENSAIPVIDRFTFGFENDLPLDGINSLNQDFGDSQTCDVPNGSCFVAFNSPKNFSDEAGVITVRGDTNNDAKVTGADLIGVQQNFGKTGPADGLLLGDANDDGLASGADLVIVQQSFGKTLTSTGAASAAPVPEPGAFGLLLAAGAVYCGRRS